MVACRASSRGPVVEAASLADDDSLLAIALTTRLPGMEMKEEHKRHSMRARASDECH